MAKPRGRKAFVRDKGLANRTRKPGTKKCQETPDINESTEKDSNT